MADEQEFIEDGLQRSQIDEFFGEELERAGYGGMEIAYTPMGTQIVLHAEKPGMVIGKGGKNIRKVTTALEEQFDLEDPQIDVQEVDEPDLNGRIVADRLANALERGWYFRKAGHTTVDRIMESGALGAEIVLSGKVTGARSRVEKFNRGYIKHNGEPAEEIVDEGQGVAVMKLGTIGVTVKIIPPDADLPDDFEVEESADVEDLIVEPDDGVDELLAGGPEASDASEAEFEDPEEPDEALPDDIDEEVLDAEYAEEAAEQSDSEATDSAEDTEESASSDDPAADIDEDVEAEAEELLEEMEDEEADAPEASDGGA